MKADTLRIPKDRLDGLPPICVFTGAQTSNRAVIKTTVLVGLIPLPLVLVAMERTLTIRLPMTIDARRRYVERWKYGWIATPVAAILPVLAVGAIVGPEKGGRVPIASVAASVVGLCLAVVAAALYFRARTRISIQRKGDHVTIRRVHPTFIEAYRAGVVAPTGPATPSPFGVPIQAPHGPGPGPGPGWQSRFPPAGAPPGPPR